MTQRTWLITGIGNGFGRHLSEQLLARGDRVAGTVRNPSSVDELRDAPRRSALVARIDVYDATPAGSVRRMLADATGVPLGDPARRARVMIDSVEFEPAPSRIVLGSDADAAIGKALGDRLASLRQQRALALSTDAPDRAGGLPQSTRRRPR